MNLEDVLHRYRKYTLVKFSRKGFLEAEKFTLVSVIAKKVGDGQVKYTLVKSGPVHELKWDKFIHLSHHEQFVIWEGYHKVNTAICVSRGTLDIGQAHTICEKRWPTFDPRYILRAIGSVNAPPVAHYVEPLQPEILLNYQCISS